MTRMTTNEGTKTTLQSGGALTQLTYRHEDSAAGTVTNCQISTECLGL